jgi:uncharacterized membrane protein
MSISYTLNLPLSDTLVKRATVCRFDVMWYIVSFLLQYIFKLYDVWYNDDRICKIISHVFFILITPHLRNETIYHMTSKRQTVARLTRVSLNGRLRV